MGNKIKVTYKLLRGSDMPFSFFGMSGCVHGMYTECREVYHYGIKGIFGIRIIKEWGSNIR